MIDPIFITFARSGQVNREKMADDQPGEGSSATEQEVQGLLAQMEVQQQRARKIADYVADLREKCGDDLDAEILSGERRVRECFPK